MFKINCNFLIFSLFQKKEREETIFLKLKTAFDKRNQYICSIFFKLFSILITDQFAKSFFRPDRDQDDVITLPEDG